MASLDHPLRITNARGDHETRRAKRSVCGTRDVVDDLRGMFAADESLIMMMRRIGFGVLLLLCGGCAGQAHVAQARAEYDLGCDKETIHAYRVVGGTYVAEGCGVWTEYTCSVSGTCVRIESVHQKPDTP